MKLINKAKWGLTLLAITLVVFGIADATTLLKMELSEVYADAENIIVATVQESQCQYSEYDGKIYTYTNVTVDQAIKGDAAMTETIVKTPGGSIGEVTMEVPGTPELITGEQYIFFLYNAKPEYLSNLVGFTQGKYSILNGIVQENGKPVDEFINELKSLNNATEQ